MATPTCPTDGDGAQEQDDQLESLSLYGNNGGAAGMRALQGALANNHCLTTLALAGNDLNAAALEILIQLLTANHTLVDITSPAEELGEAAENRGKVAILNGFLKRNRLLAGLARQIQGSDLDGAAAALQKVGIK